MKITDVRDGRLTDPERLELARLLIKGGHTVRTGKEKPQGKTTFQHYVEIVEDIEKPPSDGSDRKAAYEN